MLLILTHENADFDAVASQMAASRLYPDASPLLPRRINRNVNQFLTLYWDVLPFVRPMEWKRRRVDKVLIVDTQTVNSVRGMVRDPQVHVIDHHVVHQRTEGWTYEIGEVGATTTLLVERLRSAGLSLSAEEATLLLLGIYEDTGSLTYATTTSRDLLAAAFLLDNGAQLSVLRRFLNVALTAEQRDLYDRLQQGAEWVDMEGHSIVIANAKASVGFDDEISSVAHRLREALSPEALVVLVEIHNDVQMVARSNSGYVDVSLMARSLGGGGHDRASAAMVVGKSLDWVRDQVIELLPQAIKPMATVSQIMSYGVQTLSPEVSVVEAAEMMRRFGYEGYPIVDAGERQLVGLLTRRTVDRAISHGLGQLPVSRVMRAGTVMVHPSDSIARVQELMLEEGWGQIPVFPESEPGVKFQQPIGVVTRTDVLSYLFQPEPRIYEHDMRQMLEAYLPGALWGMVLVVSETADALDMPLYFVGGIVRDLLLNNEAADLDMVVEGDAIQLVRSLQERFGGEIHTHSRFGTGKWFVTQEIWQAIVPGAPTENLLGTIDFVTARSEFYTAPSALPEVERGSIKLDLHRRDFSINTLAVRLDGRHLGELLDFYGGQRDLEQGVIRVLHSLSFVDDPTRILRAVRLEQRLGFRIEARTAELLTAGLPMLDQVTGSRIRHEIELALKEDVPAKTMERLAALGVLSHIYPSLNWTSDMTDLLFRGEMLRADPVWGPAISGSLTFFHFALWMVPLNTDVRMGVMERLKVRKTTREDIKAVGWCLEAANKILSSALPSQVVQALQPFRSRVLAVVRAAAAETGIASLIDRYYCEWRQVKTVVSGDDLRQLGLKPGPEYAVILDRLLAARLDGEVVNEKGERELLSEIIAGYTSKPSS